MSDIAWFRQNGSKWHEGQYRARCGETADLRVAVTDLRPDIERPYEERCPKCVLSEVSRMESRVAALDEEIADLEHEKSELTDRIAWLLGKLSAVPA